MKNFVRIDETIDLLNSLLEADRKAITELFHHRVSCNVIIAEHPTVQVIEDKDGYKVGIMGVLNGLFGMDDMSNAAIAYEYNKDTKEIIKFVRLGDPELVIGINKF